MNFHNLLTNTITITFFYITLISSDQWYNEQALSSSLMSSHSSCRYGCVCDTHSVECKNRLLRNVPENMPADISQLNLFGNRFIMVRKSDFANLVHLKILELSNNRITTIEQGAFDSQMNLIKLNLNRNLIQYLPNQIFKNLKKLETLDLRDNLLQCINDNLFTGLDDLKSLYLERNRIFWISEAVTNLIHITNIQIESNKLTCNCHMAWLNRFLKHRPEIFQPDAKKIICNAPSRLSLIPLGSLSSYEFQCSNKDKRQMDKICMANLQICSPFCKCLSQGIVNCMGKDLLSVPQDLPTDIVELDLRNNDIRILKQGVFDRYKNLKKILLSHNSISDIEPGTFKELSFLTSLYLNSNKLKTLRKNSLMGLTSLMFLYLHNNELECLPSDSFKDLQRLYLLHLSKNRLRNIKNGTLANFKRLRYLYLVSNPIHCDCSMRWFIIFLGQKRDVNAAPTATCASPPVHFGQPLRRLTTYDLNCDYNNDESEPETGECAPKLICPPNCHCTTYSVNCSSIGLTTVPESISPTTKYLYLSRNNIKNIEFDAIFSKLPNLIKLDLSLNRMEYLKPNLFIHNQNIRELNLQSNFIKCVNNQTFKTLINLQYLDLSHNQIRCISPGSFQYNINIKHIFLQNNRLHCNCHLQWMNSWARDNYHKLIKSSDSNSKTDLLLTGPTCFTPPLLTDTPITSLNDQYFQCNMSSASSTTMHSLHTTQMTHKTRQWTTKPSYLCGTDNVDELCCPLVKRDCSTINGIRSTSRAVCPDKCKCEGTKVDCSELQLTYIPSDIPNHTTELYLDRNDLKILNETSFVGLTNLKTLVLSYNGITELNANVLTPLKNLETLVLSFNKLQCIHQDAFLGLFQLKVLILQSNDVSTIPYQTFRDLKNLNNIALGQNPFHCDCNIKWLNQFFLARFLDNGISLCAGPERMKLKSIYHSKPTGFVCSEDTEDAYVTAKCNACMKLRPCQNNGKCELITHHKYRCQCQHPFHGKHCDKKINACFGKPCRNGGICKNMDNFGNYECICRLGFRGPKCDENIDDCAGNKCQNNATCLDKVNGYECKCQNGFRGQHCQNKFTYCQQINPCQNGGQCELLPNNNFKCKCSTGWNGVKCEENIDDCAPQPCHNNAQCIDGLNTYKCVCRPGYEGSLCDRPSWTPPSNDPFNRNNQNSPKADRRRQVGQNYPSKYDPAISESACAYLNCFNGGVCVPGKELAGTKSYCKCKPGYSGSMCQHLDTIQVSGPKSFVQVTPPSRGYLMPRGNISLYFITNSSSGILLYQGGTERSYLTVNLYKGHLRVGFNLGDNIIGPEGYSMTKVNDDKPHHLVISISGENLTMILDKKSHTTLKSKFRPNNRYLTLATPIYIGSIPQNILNIAVSHYHIDNTAIQTHFIGCIHQLAFNNRPVDFLKYLPKLQISHSVKPGCNFKNFDVLTSLAAEQQTTWSSNQSSTTSKIIIHKNSKNQISASTDSSNKRKFGPNHPCFSPNICKNGGVCKLKKRNAKRKFKCICKKGFAGKTCGKKAYMCRRKNVRNFVRDPDTGCVSVRRIKYRYCDGQCHTIRSQEMQGDVVQQSFFYRHLANTKSKLGSSTSNHDPKSSSSSKCCQPFKYRTRRIQFRCQQTGRQYKRGVHFVRRCKCMDNCSDKN